MVDSTQRVTQTAPASSLHLRPLQVSDESTMVALDLELATEGFTVLFRRDEFSSWVAYVEAIHTARDERHEVSGMTPCHCLLAEVGGVVVGVVWVRFNLDELRALSAGHVGYCVLPEHRRRGYASEMLTRALVIARSEGVDPITVNCRSDNVASRAVIERAGGQLASEVDRSDGAPMCHFTFGPPTSLTLRPFRDVDRDAATQIHATTVALDDFEFLLGYEPLHSWKEFVRHESDHRIASRVSPQYVLAYQLAAVVDGELVGRTSIRFSFTDFLFHYGGHIGYCVVPEHRRRGYATEILRQALIVWRARASGETLMICNDDNVGSAHAIETNGGVLEGRTMDEDGTAIIRRYWIR